MNLIEILKSRSTSFYMGLIALSVTNSLLNMALLMFINYKVTGRTMDYLAEYDWAVFLGIVIISFVFNKVFQTYMIKLTNAILLNFEISIFDKLKEAPFESYEKLGNERVFTAINDTRNLANLPEVFMNALNSAIIILCCLIYLFWISVWGGLTILVLMISLATIYLLRNRYIELQLNKLRDLHNIFYAHLSDLLRGFKEIKMGATRNNSIHSYLIDNRKVGTEISVKTGIKFLDNELAGSYSWHIVLGIIMFLLPAVTAMRQDEMIAFIITILYLIGPVAVLITLIPTYTRVRIALERLNGFERQIEEYMPVVSDNKQTKIESDFKSLRFENVMYDYFDDEKNKIFSLGPLNVEIEHSEMVFVTGGNGSGKSTFVNLLTGLYYPTSGEIYYNDILIEQSNYSDYRNKMSAIFTNNYLFGTNYDEFDFDELRSEIEEYSSLMQMDGLLKTDFEANVFSRNLSKGQHKRVAMINTLLENKEVVVLDEWAAEQDPKFRSYFYRSLLAYLKKRGGTIVAVTHDDDYYYIADRVIKFNFGKIVSDSSKTEQEIINKEKETV